VTKRRRRRNPKVKQQLRLPSFRDQVQCATCQRYRLRRDDCWFCRPPWPDPCVCDDVRFQHVHLEHELLEHLSQLDYESIDETILLPTERWPTSDDDVLDFDDEAKVGVEIRSMTDPAPTRYKPRVDWREQPEYRAFLASHPELREKAKKGIDGIFAYFGLTASEADVWSMDAAGYTHEYIAAQLTDERGGRRFKPGGVAALLEGVRSKVDATMARVDMRRLGSVAS
jgi:hypothetical protein